MASTDTESPLIPARMLNELYFCERLFHLEFVGREWRGNDDTAEGDWVHRRVDRKRGSAPSEPGVDWPAETYSLRLESEKLGISAVIDRIDASDGSVSPVDYKKGHPGPDGVPWPSDRIQIEAQGALLREAGFNCHTGWLYYATTHERIEVPLGEASDERVRQAVDRARSVAARLVPPLPLEDARRCIRCSLSPVCLPEEVNALRGRRATLERSILPKNPDSRPLYVTAPGATVGVKQSQVVVRQPGEEERRLRMIDVSHVAVFGNVQISTQALTKLWAAGIPILWLSGGGWLQGWAAGQPRKNVALRRAQFTPHLSHQILARGVVTGKIKNQRTLLRRNAKTHVPGAVFEQLDDLVEAVKDAKSNTELMGIEGTAARLYFAHFPRLLTSGDLAFDFEAHGRQRRPATDPVNAALGFCYSMLTKELVAACLGVGLDPYVGVLHADRFGRPSMALDLMEEFRPLIADSVVLQGFNTGELARGHFEMRGGACLLSAEGRRRAIQLFERRLESCVTHPVFGYRIAYRRILDVQVRLAAALLSGEIDEYPPMVTR